MRRCSGNTVLRISSRMLGQPAASAGRDRPPSLRLWRLTERGGDFLFRAAVVGRHARLPCGIKQSHINQLRDSGGLHSVRSFGE